MRNSCYLCRMLHGVQAQSLKLVQLPVLRDLKNDVVKILRGLPKELFGRSHDGGIKVPPYQSLDSESGRIRVFGSM